MSRIAIMTTMKNIEFKARNLTTNEIIADKVRIANDFKSRSIGLLNRSSLGAGEGLLIKPCNAIHTFFMKFPIDVLFLDSNGKIVKIVRSLKPWKLCVPVIKGYMTLEIPDNSIDKINVKIGDLIEFEN